MGQNSLQLTWPVQKTAGMAETGNAGCCKLLGPGCKTQETYRHTDLLSPQLSGKSISIHDIWYLSSLQRVGKRYCELCSLSGPCKESCSGSHSKNNLYSALISPGYLPGKTLRVLRWSMSA